MEKNMFESEIPVYIVPESKDERTQREKSLSEMKAHEDKIAANSQKKADILKKLGLTEEELAIVLS